MTRDNPTISRSIEILRQDGIIELLRRMIKHAHLKNRILRHPLVLQIYGRYLQYLHKKHPEKYSDADPLKVLHINPNEIKCRVRGVPREWGRLTDGNWELIEIQEQEYFRSLEKRFVGGKDWEELPFDNELGREKDRIYNSIRENGFKTQSELEDMRHIRSWIAVPYRDDFVAVS